MRSISEKPDAWTVIKIEDDKSTWYKLFASWNGGYLGEDSWRMNSGIEKIEETENDYLIHGFSGSCYKCNKYTYGKLNSYTHKILSNIIENSHMINVKSEDITFEEFKEIANSI